VILSTPVGSQRRRRGLIGYIDFGRTAAVLSLVVVAGAADVCRAERASRGDKAPARTEKELPAPALFGRVSPSIVVIVATGKEVAQGSGVVIGPGRVVTNNHVIAGAKKLEVRQGETRWPATLEAFDPKHDLAPGPAIRWRPPSRPSRGWPTPTRRSVAKKGATSIRAWPPARRWRLRTA
jgi:hypothetical protein